MKSLSLVSVAWWHPPPPSKSTGSPVDTPDGPGNTVIGVAPADPESG